jgi:outer membrane protein TolC
MVSEEVEILEVMIIKSSKCVARRFLSALMISTMAVLDLSVIKANEVQKHTVTSYKQLIELVKENNPDLKSYHFNMDKAEREVKIAKAYRLPQASGTFSTQRNMELATTPIPAEVFGGEPGSTTNVQFGTNYAYNAGITITKSILDWQSMLQLKMAKISVEQAEVQKGAFEQLLEQQTGLYYYAALVGNQSARLWKRDLDLADSVVMLVSQRYEEGLLDALTVNHAEINASVIRQNLNSSEQLYSQSVSELKKLLGYSSQDILVLDEKLPYDLPEMFSSAMLTPSLDIEMAMLSKDQAKAQVAIQKSLFLPKLSFNSYFGKQLFDDDLGLALGDGAWNNYSYLGITLSVPLFTGLSNYNQLKVSKIDVEVAQNELEKVMNTAALADYQLLEDYHISLKNTKLAKNTLELYQENRKLSYQQYKEGLISLDKYLTAFEDYLKSEHTFLNTLLDTYNHYSQVVPRLIEQ